MEKLLSIFDLKARGIRYSRSHLYRLMRDGKFPQLLKLSDNCVVLVEREVDEWVEEKLRQRDADDQPPTDPTE